MIGQDHQSRRGRGCPEGTDVEVSDLFYNMPVRETLLPSLMKHVEGEAVNEAV